MKKLLKPVFSSVLAVFLFTFIFGLGTEIAHSPAGWRGALMISSVATVIAILVILMWGIPVHIFLQRYKKTALHWYLICGSLPGFIIVFVFYPFGKDKLSALLMQSVSLSLVGILAASVFWFFSRVKN